ncbi:MAG: histone deacetylase [Candidatus Kapaibacteriales bacterium]
MFNLAWHKTYNHPLPEGHKFPMDKYDILFNKVSGKDYISKEITNPNKISRDIAELAHTREYLDRLLALDLEKREARKMGFPVTELLMEREFRIMEGTRKLAEDAFDGRIGFNIAGGTHHAFSDRPEGFCLLNDHAIAAKWLVESGNSRRVLVIDLDVHQGNGTAEICKGDDRIFTFSMHGKDNYPLEKEKSDLDIGLPTGCGGKQYLNLLDESLSYIGKRFKADFILYQCGADVLHSDKFGRMSLSQDDVYLRDKMVFEFSKNNSLPIVSAMGGGYSPDISDIVNVHLGTFEAAAEVFGH